MKSATLLPNLFNCDLLCIIIKTISVLLCMYCKDLREVKCDTRAHRLQPLKRALYFRAFAPEAMVYLTSILNIPHI